MSKNMKVTATVQKAELAKQEEKPGGDGDCDKKEKSLPAAE